MDCPCGSDTDYQVCCRIYHNGKNAPTAEKLMRSRYSAYVKGLSDYVHKTWHTTTRPSKRDLAGQEPVEWLGLEVLKTQGGTAEDQQGTVEFIASFQEQGKLGKLHEMSRFIKERGKWFYVDGDYDSQ